MSCSDTEIALAIAQLTQDLLVQSPIYHCCVSLLILILVLLIVMILSKIRFVSSVKSKMRSKFNTSKSTKTLIS